MKRYIILLCFTATLTACNKQNDWLDTKSNKADIVPSKLQDYQAILDYDAVMNSNYPSLGILGADNFYLTYSTWQNAILAAERNAYIWAKEVYEGRSINDWNLQYQKAEYANIVLEGLNKIPAGSTTQDLWNNVRGSALFYRAYAFYSLAQLFAKPYTAATSETDLGIPLRLTSDVNEPSRRANLQDTYNQIIKDLTDAQALLPQTPAYKTRPSKIAADALLARIYLNMEDYANANQYAATALGLYNTLIDYNTLTTTANFPLPTFQNNNTEVIFYAITSVYSTLSSSNLLVDSNLYQSYNLNDLRRVAFFKTNTTGTVGFKGQYSGLSNFFTGIATNELYLIRSETFARLNDVTAAMADLNTLLKKRWKTNSFTPLTATNADDALGMILQERRKELPFTGSLRWEDLKRLNKDPRFAKTLTRILNGQTYTLNASDPKYVYPIPDDQIRLSGIQQNPR